MAEVIEKLADFAGFACKYELSKNPFFKPIVVENLRKLKATAAGKSLLSEIAVAAPRKRGDFPTGVNVICVPIAISFTQSGYKREVMYGLDHKATTTGMSPPGCPFWMAGGSSNEAVDQMAAGDGSGTVCLMRFSNVQVKTSKGETAHPFVVLAHELIHSLHCLQGIRMDGKDEELWTTGIGKYANNPMSENAFRGQFGLPLRNAYF